MRHYFNYKVDLLHKDTAFFGNQTQMVKYQYQVQLYIFVHNFLSILTTTVLIKCIALIFGMYTVRGASGMYFKVVVLT